MYPARILSLNPEETFLPKKIYTCARGLFDREQYQQAIECLKSLEVVEPVVSATTKDIVSLRDIYLLYCNCLLNAKMHNEFTHWILQLKNDVYCSKALPCEFALLEYKYLALRGDYNEAMEGCCALISGRKDFADRVAAGAMFLKGYIEHRTGNGNAVSTCETAYYLYLYFGIHHEAASVANYLGFIVSGLGKFSLSLSWYAKSLEYYSQSSLQRKQSMVLLNTGICHYKTGDFPAALDCLQESLQIGLDGGWSHRQCFANIALGNVRRILGDPERARKHLHAAYNQAQKLEMRREEALALEFLGDVYRDEDRPEEARRFYRRARAIAEDIAPEGDIVMELERRVGECLAMEGEPTEAATHLAQSLKMARKIGDRYEEGVIHRVMASVQQALGATGAARAALDESVAVLEEIGARHELAISLLHRGEARITAAQQERPNHDLAGRAEALDGAWSDCTRALEWMIQVDLSWWIGRAKNLADRIQAAKAHLEKDRQADAAQRAGGPSALSPNLIVHTSVIMRDMIQLCDMFAAGSDPVLVCGETGTGKELVARRLHQQSPRRDRPLVIVNVAAIAPSMFEREFFGHTKGAFSGADRDGVGFAASAHGGTLFLDEIGELPLEMQPKLLRLIQDGSYQAIGDPSSRHTDLRLVAATNADLAAMVERGEFRSDLYYRLKVLDLHVPPVRRRRDDILPLLRHFLSLAAGRAVEPLEYFCSSSLDRLLDYSWPGNVREVAMVARRAVMEMKLKGRVRLDLGAEGDEMVIKGPDRRLVSAAVPGHATHPGGVGKAERARIIMALEECGGNRNAAARRLGVGRSTLYRRMEKLGIPTRKD